MSLLLKALQQADRGSNLSLEPMEERVEADSSAPPASAKAAAALMLEKQANAEKRRLWVLLGLLVTVVLGMGVYFYLAVFMPWVFLPKPAAAAPAQVSPVQAVSVAPPASAPLAPLAQAPEPAAPVQAPAHKADATSAPQHARPVASAPIQDSGIQISGGSATVSPVASGVMRAYQQLQEGRLEEARRAYEGLRVQEPRNTDVLLGLALIAQRQGRVDDAAPLYLKVLETDPKNAFAQASLSGLIARADPAAAEAKLKALIAQQPAAFLYFRLGNVYAAQGRWNEAQAAYFEAQRLDVESPDYAFNLAISLERIHQPRAALDYYQRALKLAQTKAAAFDAGQAQARIQQLSVAK
jgi:tetratricopeptide (TPR) repeat protein